MRVFDWSLDFADGSADGLHVYGTGLASEAAVEAAVKTALSASPTVMPIEPYYEFANDEETTGLIFITEDAAASKAEPIGKFAIRTIPN